MWIVRFRCCDKPLQSCEDTNDLVGQTPEVVVGLLMVMIVTLVFF